MQPTALLRQAAHARVPMIKFLGKRSIPSFIDHSPKPHPMSPAHELPDSFKTYRAKAQQHGPLAARTAFSVGGSSGASLGPVRPRAGEVFDRSELPRRFHRLAWSDAEIEAIETGGASLCA
ncbi:Ribosomal protein YMR-31, mitochondrial [Ascosphaera apis ARSEF 7405]|uniref:Ribosomal protein YMR-31, mitochondrial n=1 Tax=Ascosphaera apis ARSEF 7405 TaxID=392613 RepID=A0A168CT03_9EURO|nr:Ribosomal protein YMR-31, mitochondrial [Ascosphaera apis ARSEF 7405]